MEQSMSRKGNCWDNASRSIWPLHFNVLCFRCGLAIGYSQPM